MKNYLPLLCLVVLFVTTSCSKEEPEAMIVEEETYELSEEEILIYLEELTLAKYGGCMVILNNIHSRSKEVSDRFRDEPINCGETKTAQESFSNSESEINSNLTSDVSITLECKETGIPENLKLIYTSDGSNDSNIYNSSFSSYGEISVTNINPRDTSDYLLEGYLDRTASVGVAGIPSKFQINSLLKIVDFNVSKDNNSISSGTIDFTVKITYPDAPVITESATATFNGDQSITLNYRNKQKTIDY